MEHIFTTFGFAGSGIISFLMLFQIARSAGQSDFTNNAANWVSLIFVPIAASLGCLAPSDAHSLNEDGNHTILIAACALSFGVTIFFTKLYAPLRQRPFLTIGIFLAGIGSGAAIASSLNDLDRAQVLPYQARILQKFQYPEGNHIDYEIRSGPWGPLKENQQLYVTEALFKNVKEGDEVCIAYHEGVLYVPWYTIRKCE